MSAQVFCHKFRFIDDLITINNENFEKNIWNIHLAELEHKKENQINKNANFLDLNINKLKFKISVSIKFLDFI